MLRSRLRRRVDRGDLASGLPTPAEAVAANRELLLDGSTYTSVKSAFDLNALAAALCITPEMAQERFRDGRTASVFIEDVLAHNLGIEKAESSNAAYDVRDGGEKHEVRCLTKGGLSFAPSGMIGSGRTFDLAKFREKLDLVSAFFIADIVEFPAVTIHVIPSKTVSSWYDEGRLTKQARLSLARARALFTELAGAGERGVGAERPDSEEARSLAGA